MCIRDSFRSYLKRFNRADDSYCVYCVDPDDTVEHTVFTCPRWLDDRVRMTEIMRRSPNAGDVEEILCGPLPHDLPEDAQARRRIINSLKLIAWSSSAWSRRFCRPRKRMNARKRPCEGHRGTCDRPDGERNIQSGQSDDRHANSRAADPGRPEKVRKKSSKTCNA